VSVRVDDIFAGIGRFSVKFRWAIVIFWLAAAVVIPSALPSLSNVAQGNNQSFLPASAPSEHAINLATAFGNPNQTPVPVIAARTSGPLTQADVQWITGTLMPDLGKVSTISKVRFLGESQSLPGVTGQGAQIQALSSISGGGGGSSATTLVDNLRTAITSAHAPAGLQVHVTGALADAVDNQKQNGNTTTLVLLGSIVIVFVILLLVFRSLLAPLITLLPAALTVRIAGPIVAEAAQHGLKVSFLAQILLSVLVIGAGTDYGLFLVFRVREHIRRGETAGNDYRRLASRLTRGRIRRGDTSSEAVVTALTKVGESITFSALTVIAALLSLLAASFQIYSTLGIPLAIAIAVMLLAGLTLLPALLAIHGRAAFWPTKIRVGDSSTGAWGAIAARVVKRPAVALGTGLVIFGALSVAVTAYAGSGFGGSSTAPSGSDSARGDALVATYFPSTSSNPTELIYQLPAPVWDNPAPLDAAVQQLKASGQFTTIAGPLNPFGGPNALTPTDYTGLHQLVSAAIPSGQLPATMPPALASQLTALAHSATEAQQGYQAYQASSHFVSADGKTIMFLVGLSAGDASSTKAMNAVPAIRTAAASVAPTLHATTSGVLGFASVVYDINQISSNDLTNVIPIAIVIIGVLLALVMRSLVAPLYLIASVAVSYFAALGTAVLLFLKLGGDSGLTFILPFLLFIFLLALGEDYNILVMTRIREEAHKMTLTEAVRKAIGVTGTTVTSAGLVLASTFAVFGIVGALTPGGEQLRDMGLGLTIGILMDTFVVRTVLVPCTCVLLGRWNWWPSKLTVDTPDADAVTESADALGLVQPAVPEVAEGTGDARAGEEGAEVSP
jgi:putative drug exporter of the RND superfamily